jgi:hypothetical protein
VKYVLIECEFLNCIIFWPVDIDIRCDLLISSD